MTREESLAKHPIIICEVSAYAYHKSGEVIVNVRAKAARLSGKNYIHPDNTRTAVSKLMKLDSVYNDFTLARQTHCLESDVDEAIRRIRDVLKSEADRLAAYFTRMQSVVTVEPDITYHGKKDGAWEL
jgi:hypothetical protein